MKDEKPRASEGGTGFSCSGVRLESVATAAQREAFQYDSGEHGGAGLGNRVGDGDVVAGEDRGGDFH